MRANTSPGKASRRDSSRAASAWRARTRSVAICGDRPTVCCQKAFHASRLSVLPMCTRAQRRAWASCRASGEAALSSCARSLCSRRAVSPLRSSGSSGSSPPNWSRLQRPCPVSHSSDERVRSSCCSPAVGMSTGKSAAERIHSSYFVKSFRITESDCASSSALTVKACMA